MRAPRAVTASGSADSGRPTTWQQRVAVVPALVTSQVLMQLDAVTSAADPELVGEVLAMLTDLAGEGTTMLVATHEMSFARDVADTVVSLDAD